MPGKLLKYEEMSSPQFSNLIREKTAFFIPISPLEGHGPHLPLGVDFFNAIHFADSIAKITVEKFPDFDAVVVPGIPLGTGVYRQPGSLRIGAIPLYELVRGIGESLASFGFRYIFLLSGHGSPKHIVAMEAACLKVSRKRGIHMHNLSGALAIRFLKGEFIDRISANLPRPLNESERGLFKSDIHGGWWETSMMLLLRPELVDENYKNLPSVERGPKTRSSDSGYFGTPSRAYKEFAEASLGVMAEEASLAVERIISGKAGLTETISHLYRMIPLRPYFRRNLYAILLILITLGLILLVFSG